MDKKRKTGFSVLLVLILFTITGYSLLRGQEVRSFASWREAVLPVHIEAGRYLGAHYPDTTMIATGNAGVIPYESNLPCIDMLGLTDRVIAARPLEIGAGMPGHEKGDGLYVLSRHPDLILFMASRFTEEPVTGEEVQRSLFGISEHEIWETPVFHANYTLHYEKIGAIYFNYYLLNARQQDY